MFRHLPGENPSAVTSPRITAYSALRVRQLNTPSSVSAARRSSGQQAAMRRISVCLVLPMAARPASRWRPAIQPGSSSSVGSPAAALCTSLRAALHGTWRECRPRLTISPFPLTDDRRPSCGGYLVMTAGDAAHSDLSAGPCVPTPRTGPALACKRCPHNPNASGGVMPSA